MTSINLAYFPCGCLADYDRVIKIAQHIECPWCGATFTIDDTLSEWFAVPRGVYTIEPTHCLISVSGHILEVVGASDYETLLVRERPGQRVRELNASMNDVMFLEN